MAGTLFVVTTPIGNLQDLTPRAAQTFTDVDFIAAEDTRVTLKLLNHLGIKKPLVSYYEHSAPQRQQNILQRIAQGENCALCSDAGVPAISDPGEDLVRQAHALGIRVVPVPAASAAITALCVSGQVTSRFVFEGFLPQNRRQRQQRLAALQGEERTIILYEAPHKLMRTLQDLLNAFGPQRGLSICRELTKLHEEILVTTVAQALEIYTTKPPKGEFVLVLAGAPPQAPPEAMSLDEAVQLALTLKQTENLSASDAAKKAAGISGCAKSAIYRQMQPLH